MSNILDANLSETFIVSETRDQSLVRAGRAHPRFLQGVYPFAGRGVYDLAPLNNDTQYIVPTGCTAEVVYFRAGNLSEDLLYFTLSADGVPLRYFPIGPKSDLHVPLAIVEIHPAGTKLEICLAAPRGLTGTVVIDIGILEITNQGTL